MEELLAQIDQVGLVAKHLITVIKFSHLGKDYAPDEKRAACDALDAGLAALKVSSAADGAATEERMPRAQTLGVMLAAKLDSDFYEALENGKHWEDNKERQRLRANLRRGLRFGLSLLSALVYSSVRCSSSVGCCFALITSPLSTCPQLSS